MLTEYLASRDEACPGCGYNLRGLVGDRCPECNQQLRVPTDRGKLKIRCTNCSKTSFYEPFQNA